MFDIDRIAVTCERTGTRHHVSIALPVRYEALTASGDGSAIPPDECGRALELGHMIREQVLPMIERDHPIGDRWFVGHSFSALAGLRFLFDDPSLFYRWVLASPSIWWDNRAILSVEDDYAAANTDLPAQVVITAGTDEHLAPYNMAANAELLAERLRSRNYPNLRVTSAELDGATHTSTIGAAVSAGLRALHK